MRPELNQLANLIRALNYGLLMKHCVAILLITLTSWLFCYAAQAKPSAALASSMQARWFEIEVILFKQNVSMQGSHEQFTALKTPKKTDSIDLLSPFLQTDISRLKQFLSSCDNSQNSNVTFDLPQTFNHSTLNFNLNRHQSQPNKPEPLFSLDDELLNTFKLDNVAKLEANGGNQFANTSSYNQHLDFTPETFCINNRNITSQLTAEQLWGGNFDSLPVGKLPATISGIEQWQDNSNGEITWASKKPYLINESSLKLKTIAARLRRSRDYNSVLHLGWRQIGASKNAAKPFRLFAGENLYDDYLQKNQQFTYQTMQMQGDDSTEFNTSMVKSQQRKQQQLAKIFSNLKTINATLQKPLVTLPAAESTQSIENTESFANVADIDSPSTSPELTALSAASSNVEKPLYSNQDIDLIVGQLSSNSLSNNAAASSENAAKPIPPSKPLQPWSIDGLFKIHLNHYLFINTEFTVIDPQYQAKQQALKQLHGADFSEENGIITFKQTRKVITGEIHYFDHPYMGMIVQIRRFDPTKPASEAVTQAKRQ